jgi:hypothetical protein
MASTNLRMVLLFVCAATMSAGFLLAQAPPMSSELRSLFEAVQNGQEEAAAAILDGGVDAGSAAPDGTTALHVATRAGHPALLRLLLGRGADPMARDGANMLPLHLSGAGNCTECVELLLDAGTPVDEVGFTSGDGVANSTALLLASEMGAKDVVQLLISRGANVNHVNNFRRTPLFWARKAGKSDVAALLETHGAKADPEEALQAAEAAAANKHDGADTSPVSTSPGRSDSQFDRAATVEEDGEVSGSESGGPEASEGKVVAPENSPDSSARSSRPATLTTQTVEALKVRIRANPRDWKARRALGIHLVKAGDRNLGPKLLASAVKIQPRDPVSRAHLARVLRAMGRTDAALAQYRVVCELDPALARTLAKFLDQAP